MALSEERSFPLGVIGPRERAALAREAWIRLSELISSSHRIQRRCLTNILTRLLSIKDCCERDLDQGVF